MAVDLLYIAKWIKASAATSFKANLSGLDLFIDGQDRFTNLSPDFCEFRLDGPWIKQSSNNFSILDIEINILVNCTPDPANIYKIDVLIGKVQNAMQDVILIKKFGQEATDDESVIGYFQRRDRDQMFRVNKFGQLNPKTKLIQATVEARYRMTL